LRRPLESAQYVSFEYSQTLQDHRVLQSVGSVGDAYDNALAESFLDSFKTELIADRVWRSRSQLELSIVEYIAWFNHRRLHSALGDIPPAEFEARYRAGVDLAQAQALQAQAAPKLITRPRSMAGLSAVRFEDPRSLEQ
jgi:hypothetical protein